VKPSPPTVEERMNLLENQSNTILYLCAINLIVNVLTILIAVVLASS
jgi:hypothetical protein